MRVKMKIKPEHYHRAEAIINKVFTDVRRSTQLAVQVAAVEMIKGRRGKQTAMGAGVSVEPALLPALDAFEWYADRVGRPTGRGFPCLWSGEKTIRPEARFIPGYDAKMKSQLQRIVVGKAEIASISLEARWFLMTDQMCGFKIREGILQRASDQG